MYHSIANVPIKINLTCFLNNCTREMFINQEKLFCSPILQCFHNFYRNWMQIGLRTIYGRYLLCRCEQQKLGKIIRMISNRAPLPPPIEPSGPTASSVERVEFVKRAQMFDYWQVS
jgi:hypothetical protein